MPFSAMILSSKTKTRGATHAINRITYDDIKENELTTTINALFRNFDLSKLLRRSKVYKEKGILPVLLFHKLFALMFLHRGLFEELKSYDFGAVPNSV